jgi:hypothetical protein
MEKVIELLEQAEGFALAGSRSTAVSCIEEALAEPKALPRYGGQRVQCNWCESVFDEKYIEVIDDIEYCPVCDKTGYLMDITKEEAE